MNFDVDTWKDVARELGADVSCRWDAADASVEVAGFYEIGTHVRYGGVQNHWFPASSASDICSKVYSLSLKISRS